MLKNREAAYESIIVRIYVNGHKDNSEREWARNSALKVNHWIAKYVSKIQILYKWDYMKIWNALAKFLMIFAGGYDFKRRRKTVLNLDYEIKPITWEHKDMSTHYIDDMIFVEDLGK